jgi:hypothetical protein
MDTERTGPARDSTGDPRVDEAISRLARLREAPLDEHPPVLEAVHDRLREILGELSTVPPGGANGVSPRGAPDGQWKQDAPRPARPGERGQQGELGPGQ